MRIAFSWVMTLAPFSCFAKLNYWTTTFQGWYIENSSKVWSILQYQQPISWLHHINKRPRFIVNRRLWSTSEHSSCSIMSLRSWKCFWEILLFSILATLILIVADYIIVKHEDPILLQLWCASQFLFPFHWGGCWLPGRMPLRTSSSSLSCLWPSLLKIPCQNTARSSKGKQPGNLGRVKIRY